MIANQVIHEVGNNANGIGEFLWAWRVVAEVAFGEHHGANRKTDGMLQRLFANHDLGAATTDVDDQCDAVVRWKMR